MLAHLDVLIDSLNQPNSFCHQKDGSLGTLDSLAETLSYKLETFVEDVLDALDQLRRRQLPAGLYNDVHEMVSLDYFSHT